MFSKKFIKIRVETVFFALILLIAASPSHVHGASEPPLFRIGIVTDGAIERFSEILPIVKQEILALTEGEFDVRFPEDKKLHGDWTVPGVKSAVDILLADPSVDLILALGVISSNEVCQRKNLPKPVIAPNVIDIELQGIPFDKGVSGVKNLNYITSLTRFERDIKAFQEIRPFKQMTLLVDELLLEAFPKVREKGDKVAQKYNFSMDIVPVSTFAKAALDTMPEDTEVVFVAPLVRLTPTEFKVLIDGLIERRLPSYSLFGRPEVEQGLLASVAPELDIKRLARRVALNVQRILLGEDAGTFDVTFTQGERLSINMATARAIGFWPTWDVLPEAELLHEEIEIERKLTLSGAVREAISANLDLLSSRHAVEAGKHAVLEARSILLPQIDVSGQGLIIDEDRAESSLGQNPERSTSASATLTQLIYSDEAWANFEIEKDLQKTREEEREGLKLDITLVASITYLNVLKAKTLELIQKENLKLTRSNLELARMRKLIGIAGPSEVFRWESEMGNNRRFVVEATSRRKQAETALNRLLNRPLDEAFVTEHIGLDDPELLISDERFFSYINNPQTFKIFQDFMVGEGLHASPEIKSLKAAIDAQERTVTAARRSFWLPTFSVQGKVSHSLSEGGAGSESLSIPSIPSLEKDDTDWDVLFSISYPFFSGGGKYARFDRTSEELTELRIDLLSTIERVAERVRVALQRTEASYPSIGFSQDSAEAADKNLKLITDSYSRGVVSILDLLDAQTAALVSKEVAANAAYDFLIDLMNVQRAAGKFDFFRTQKERDDWFERLEDFFSKESVVLKRP